MLLLSFVLSVIVAATTQVSAQAYDYGVDIVALTRRQDTSSPVKVGQLPLASNGSVPFRPEIRNMISNTHTWDLFILALSMLQDVSQDDPTSWYQIAGNKQSHFNSVVQQLNLDYRYSWRAIPGLEWG